MSTNTENLINQSISSIPTLFLAVTILVLAFSIKKLREVAFFTVGSMMAVLSIVSNLVFWATEPDTKELATYMLLTNVIFSAQGLLFLYGAIQILLEKKGSTNTHQSVFMLIVLSILTLGFYVPYWYIRTHSNYKIDNGMIVLLVLLLTPALVLHLYQFTDTSYATWAIAVIDVAIGVLTVIIIFNLRSYMLRAHDELEIDPVLTFFFGVFYLQYKINQVEGVES